MSGIEIGIRIYHDTEFEVWMGPTEDLKSDNVINAHIIGLGETKAQAVERAIGELETIAYALKYAPDAFNVYPVRSK